MDENAQITGWQEWMATFEGRGCAAPRSNAEGREYVLSQAFYAGVTWAEVQHTAEKQAEPKSELLDAILRTITDGPPEDDPGKAVYVAAGKFFVAMLQAALAGADYAKAHAPGGASEESPPDAGNHG